MTFHVGGNLLFNHLMIQTNPKQRAKEVKHIRELTRAALIQVQGGDTTFPDGGKPVSDDWETRK